MPKPPLPCRDTQAERQALETEPLLDELAAILRGAVQWDAFMAQLVAAGAPPLSLRATPPMAELAKGMEVPPPRAR